MKNEEMARLFSEATPYIQKYHGKTMVVKYGGNAMINEELKNAVMNDLVTLTLLGVRVVLVHGGGPAINEMLKKVGVESHFANGLRVTDDATMEIVQQVLAGKVNKDLVAKLRGEHCTGSCAYRRARPWHRRRGGSHGDHTVFVVDMQHFLHSPPLHRTCAACFALRL